MRPRTRWVAAAGTPVVVLAAVPAGTVATPASGPQALPPPPDTVAALAIHSVERAPVVAAALAFPVGSGSDPEGRSGAAALLARSLEVALRGSVPEASALVGSRVDRGSLVITLVTTPGEWPQVWSMASHTLFRDPLSPAVVERARRELLEPLRFQRGSPVRQFELESDRLLLGLGHPWARPIQGIETEMERLDASALQELHRRWIRWDEARVAVVGPVDRDDLRPLVSVRGEPEPAPEVLPADPDAVSDGAPPDSLPRDSVERSGLLPPPASGGGRLVVIPDPPPPVESGGQAWSEGARAVLERDVVNAWAMVAWPAPAGVDRTRLEFAGHVLRELLSPSPPDPGLFSISVRVEELDGGPAIRVVAAVEPGAAPRWEQQILAAARRAVESPPPSEFLELYRRRFTGQVLLAESRPEVEAQRMALDLLVDGRVRDLPVVLRGLGSDEPAATLARLGEPRILLYGPPGGSGGS